LSHEQLHFDISELYARRMREMLGRQTFGPNVRAEVRRIFKQLNQELSEFQDRYDRETDFSRDREAQAHWNAAIARRLADSQRN
jgi:predicted secreted Zn-dependent protease